MVRLTVVSAWVMSMSNGAIEIDDLLKVVGYWGEWMEDTVCEADFNRDWEVDIEDLLYVLNRWGNCNP